MRFEVVGKNFIKDGKEIKIISGAVHYFRNMPDTWDDIFKKMKALGCNCVETYCAWNMHEKVRGEFDFSGMLDLERFIRLAEANGLMVIVRPGPYICAEWEFGGLPWWLMCEEDMEIRCANPKFMEAFEAYLEQIFNVIRPLLCTNGGPVIMLQCENEYGYYGDDKEYLRRLYDIYRAHGIDVPLFTSDGVSREALLDGSIDGCFSTLNFGSNVEEKFRVHDELFPYQPKMCMEMWNGWFDAWGDSAHHTTDAQEYAKHLDDMLRRGSVNMYMFIGGTNFGFSSGANHYEKYAPDVTSYDYDALISECGDVTDKYMAVREVIKKYTTAELPEIPPNRPKKAYGKVELTASASLFDSLGKLSAPKHSDVPRPMESYGQGYGYIAYTTPLHRDYKNALFSLESLGDRAQIYINRRLAGILYVNDEKLELRFDASAGDTLTVLCENMGRANFGSKMMRKKGISGRALIDGKLHFGWEVYTLPMNELDKLEFSDNPSEEPSCFRRGHFEADEIADTFLYPHGFKKGFVTVNGFNLGRYWEIGPQQSLYVPASLLKTGENEIILFESDGASENAHIELLDYHTLG